MYHIRGANKDTWCGAEDPEFVHYAETLHFNFIHHKDQREDICKKCLRAVICVMKHNLK
jgi:hypothetical protein